MRPAGRRLRVAAARGPCCDTLLRLVVAAVVVLAAAVVAPPGARAPHRDVVTAAGAVRGYRVPSAPHHYAFLGIPYARPPTGRRRFEPPAPAPRWDGLFEATHRVRCRQPADGGVDDCLVLNVFAPARARALPVLVHVHGGGFREGWGFHEAPARLIRENIIVVSINYRLGAPGFLCLGTGRAPGNVGLADQVAALSWVRRNIGRFGGEPAEVTVYGSGSGAAAVELLVLAGVAGRLFRRAILENGSALSPSALARDGPAVAYNFAASLGYTEANDPKELEKFYSKVPTRKLTNVSRMFVPCVQRPSRHSLIDRDPWEVIREGSFHRVSMMMVYGMAEETSVIVEDAGLYKPPQDFDDLIPHNLEIDSPDHRSMIAKFIEEFYFEDRDVSVNSVESYINYVNDVFLQYPMVKSAVHHASKANVSVFLMNFSNVRAAAENFEAREGQSYDVLEYLSIKEDIMKEKELVAEKLTNLWSNFIKLGDPTPLTTSKVTTIWQPVAPLTVDGTPLMRDTRCLKFSGNMINTVLNSPQLMFWDRVYNQFYKTDQE